MWAPLASLQSIDFQGNNVTGYVPPQIMAVGSLQNISLANNGLQGAHFPPTHVKLIHTFISIKTCLPM